MKRIAASIVLLLLGTAATRAEEFSEDFVTAFRLICLSKKPHMEALKDALKSGRLHEPLLLYRGGGSFSLHTSAKPEGYPRSHRVKMHHPYTVGFRKQTSDASNGGPCLVSKIGKDDHTGALRPLVDRLSELAQPAGIMSVEERRRFGREGPKYTDPAWHVLSSPDSVVVLYYSEHMWGGTSLVRIERPY